MKKNSNDYASLMLPLIYTIIVISVIQQCTHDYEVDRQLRNIEHEIRMVRFSK